jgi:hypothetical protein
VDCAFVLEVEVENKIRYYIGMSRNGHQICYFRLPLHCQQPTARAATTIEVNCLEEEESGGGHQGRRDSKESSGTTGK